MQLDNSAEQLLSELCDPPASRVGDSGNQAPHVEPFEQPAHLGGQSSTDLGAGDVGKKSAADIAVVEATQQMVTLKDCLKQPDIAAGSGIKAGIASLSKHFSLSEPFYLTVGRRRVVDDREGFQITFVGGSGNALELVEIGDAFVHGRPDHLGPPVSHAPAADAKLARVVDHGLDPQDLAELVVHLQPVVFHAMFDPSPWGTILLRVREDFAGKIPVQLAAQEGENVLGAKVDGGVVENAPVELCEPAAAGEQDVRAVLGLLNRPVVDWTFSATARGGPD